MGLAVGLGTLGMTLEVTNRRRAGEASRKSSWVEGGYSIGKGAYRSFIHVAPSGERVHERYVQVAPKQLVKVRHCDGIWPATRPHAIRAR